MEVNRKVGGPANGVSHCGERLDNLVHALRGVDDVYRSIEMETVFEEVLDAI